MGAAEQWLTGILLGSTGVLVVALGLARSLSDGRARRFVLAAAFLSLAALPWIHGFGGLWEVSFPAFEWVGRSVETGTDWTAADPGSGSSVEAVGGEVAEGGPVAVSTGGERGPSTLFLVWALGVGAILLYRAVGVAGMIRRVRTADPVPASVQARVEAASRAAGFARGVRVLRSPRCRTPTAWSLPEPTLLLPSDCSDWGEPTWGSVLIHELSHLKARDVSLRLLALGLAALYWPQPLVWLALGRLREAQERACDQAVLASGIPAGEYAEVLLGLARSGRIVGAGHPGVAAVSRRSSLRRRVEHILHAPKQGIERRPAGLLRSMGLWAIGFGVMGGASFRPPTSMTPVPALGWAHCPSLQVPVRSVRVEAGATTVRIEGRDDDGAGVSILASDSEGGPSRGTFHCGSSPIDRSEVLVRAFDSEPEQLVVRMPRRAALAVRTGSGPISVRDLDGALDLESSSGALSLRSIAGGGRARSGFMAGITVRLAGRAWGGPPLELRTEGGPVVVVEPEGYRARLEGRSDDGSPQVRFPDAEGGLQIIEFPEAVAKQVTISSPEAGSPGGTTEKGGAGR